MQIFTLQINKYDNIPELFRTKQKTTRNDSTNELNRSDTQSDPDNSFAPSQISTPVSSKEKSVQNISNATTNAEDDSITSILSNLTTNPSNLLNSNNRTPTLVPINVVNPFQGASVVNGVIQIPQYQQILVQIPTIDILKMQAQQQQQQQQLELNGSYAGSSNTNVLSGLQSDPLVDERLISRTARYQHKLFQHLKTDLPIDVVSFVNSINSFFDSYKHHVFLKKFDDGIVGFTCHQRDILKQQLQMHVQFATQNFLQVYGNPGNNLWKQAPNLKSFLVSVTIISS